MSSGDGKYAVYFVRGDFGGCSRSDREWKNETGMRNQEDLKVSN